MMTPAIDSAKAIDHRLAVFDSLASNGEGDEIDERAGENCWSGSIRWFGSISRSRHGGGAYAFSMNRSQVVGKNQYGMYKDNHCALGSISALSLLPRSLQGGM